MDEFSVKLPKLELHAHLNGSLSVTTISTLLDHHLATWPEEPMPSGAQTLIQQGEKGTFDDPFQMFGLVHKITDNVEAVALATRSVIQDFADDGCIYLELRTTPRKMAGRMTKQEYVHAVVTQILKSKLSCPSISGIIMLLLIIFTHSF